MKVSAQVVDIKVVPRARVRGSIHRVDPENTAIRRSVTSDEEFITHCGMWMACGWSPRRTVVFLRCSDNLHSSYCIFKCGMDYQNDYVQTLEGKMYMPGDTWWNSMPQQVLAHQSIMSASGVMCTGVLVLSTMIGFAS